MAMAFGEWTRQNNGIADRAAYEDYLGGLARAAARANADSAPRTPENVLYRSLEYHEDGTSSVENMIEDLLAGLEEAGYAIVDVSPDGPGHYTREQVSDAVNGAADLLPEHEYETEESIAQDDTANLVVNAALYLLDHPGAGADEVIAAQYTDVVLHEDDLDEGEEMPEKGSARWNELVVSRVLGWVAT